MTLTRRAAMAMGRDSLERLAVELQSEVERLRAENERLRAAHRKAVEMADWYHDQDRQGNGCIGWPELDDVADYSRTALAADNPSPGNPSLEARSTGSEP